MDATGLGADELDELAALSVLSELSSPQAVTPKATTAMLATATSLVLKLERMWFISLVDGLWIQGVIRGRGTAGLVRVGCRTIPIRTAHDYESSCGPKAPSGLRWIGGMLVLETRRGRGRDGRQSASTRDRGSQRLMDR